MDSINIKENLKGILCHLLKYRVRTFPIRLLPQKFITLLFTSGLLGIAFYDQ